MVNAQEILNAVELVYYAPALLASLYVVYKHGHQREAGWFFLTLLSLFRLVSASTGLAAINSPSIGLITCSLVTRNMGTATLVGALTGIINRANGGLQKNALPPKLTRQLQLITVVAVVLGIVGGIKEASPNLSTRQEGLIYPKIATILILAGFLAAVFVTLHTQVNARYIIDAERRLLSTSLASLPFILVRLIYAICVAFRPGDSTFNNRSGSVRAVVLRACMAVAMEFITVGLFLWAGITVAPIVHKKSPDDTSSQLEEMLPIKTTSSHQHTRYEPIPNPTRI